MLENELDANSGGQVEGELAWFEPAVGARRHVEEIGGRIEIVGDPSRPDDQLKQLLKKVDQSISILIVVELEFQVRACLDILLPIVVKKRGVLRELGDDFEDIVGRLHLLHFEVGR